MAKKLKKAKLRFPMINKNNFGMSEVGDIEPFIRFDAMEFKAQFGSTDEFKDTYFLSDEEIDKNLKSANEELQATKDKIAEGKTSIAKTLKEWESSVKKVKTAEKFKKTLMNIFLPVQGGVVEVSNQNWSGKEGYRLGYGTMGLGTAVSAVMGDKQALAGLSGTAKSMLAMTLRSKEQEFNAGMKDMWKMSLHNSGESYNDYIGMTYQSPEFRTFRFSFDLRPRSKEEADELNRIIFAFKFFSSPQTDVNKTMDYPAMWRIQIKAPDYTKTGKYRSVKFIYFSGLRGVNLNNGTGNTVIFHEDGQPSVNKLELEFTELQYITRDILEMESHLTGVSDMFET